MALSTAMPTRLPGSVWEDTDAELGSCPRLSLPLHGVAWAWAWAWLLTWRWSRRVGGDTGADADGHVEPLWSLSHWRPFKSWEALDPPNLAPWPSSAFSLAEWVVGSRMKLLDIKESAPGQGAPRPLLTLAPEAARASVQMATVGLA